MLDKSTRFGEARAIPGARAVLERYLPGYVASPQAAQLDAFSLGMVAHVVPTLRDDPTLAAQLWEDLAAVEGDVAVRVHAPAVEPDPDYEPAETPRASAGITVPGPTPQWGIVELELHGPRHGNPFLDVELWAEFTLGDRTIRCGGFYDGDGVYRIRMMAGQAGRWAFVTGSTARSLDGVTGEVEVIAPAPGRHGPVRPDGFHFAYADGARHRPWGTTAYAWTHQPEDLQERTLAALARSPFTKLRMCLLPKSYLYNTNEPERFVFPRGAGGELDVTRFDPEFFRQLEARIAQLAELGIEADLILFHAYDRWGQSDLGPAVDDRLVAYTVRRLAAHANVWWSLANEYDLVTSRTEADWERIASVVQREDPHGHLLSIHNCFGFYDHTRPWVSHSSIQRVDVYRTAENTDQWREEWGKPVVIDECGYEGDLEHGWGNLTGEELVRRTWEGAVRGGYVGHGETYLNDAEEIWWSKGGELVGSSPDRIAFLESVVAASPTGVLDPLPSDWDVPWGGVPGEYLVGYIGFSRPRFRDVFLPAGEFEVDVLDTWEMTVETLPGVHSLHVHVPLPAKQYMAIRLRKVGG